MQSILPYLSYTRYLLIPLAILVITVVLLIVLIVSIQWSRANEAPADIPWAGLKDRKFLPKVRANIREFAAGRGPLEEGYEKYSKNGKAFILPALHWADVALPTSNIPWLASQPENVLSGVRAQNDILLLDTLAHGPDITACYDFTVVSRDLTRQTISTLNDILDEMKVSFDEQLPSNMGDWIDIKIYEHITSVSRRISNRLFVGLPLCRDKRYISGLSRWEVSFGICSAIIRYLIPGATLRYCFAPVVAIPVHVMRWWLSKMIIPIIRQRKATQSRIIDEKADFQRPNDALQWIMDGTARKGGTQGMTEYDIAGKTILFNFFGKSYPFRYRWYYADPLI